MKRIQTRKDLNYYLSEDRKALGIENLTFREKVHFRVRTSYSIYKFQRLLRYEEYYYNKNGKLNRALAFIIRFQKDKLGRKLGFEIPRNVFGPGLRIIHIGSIIINSGCIIGKNCTLYNDINIGIHNGICPNLGDNISIYPGAKIFGEVVLANNIVIGANSTVTKSCYTDSAILVGSPAKELNKRG